MTDEYGAWLTSLWFLQSWQFPTTQPSEHTRNRCLCCCSSPREGGVLKWVSHHMWDPLKGITAGAVTLCKSHDRHGAAPVEETLQLCGGLVNLRVLNITRKKVFFFLLYANNILCQGGFGFSCYIATLLSGKPLPLHWQTLLSLQHFRFFCSSTLLMCLHFEGFISLENFVLFFFFIFPSFHCNEV